MATGWTLLIQLPARFRDAAVSAGFCRYVPFGDLKTGCRITLQGFNSRWTDLLGVSESKRGVLVACGMILGISFPFSGTSAIKAKKKKEKQINKYYSKPKKKKTQIIRVVATINETAISIAIALPLLLFRFSSSICL